MLASAGLLLCATPLLAVALKSDGAQTLTLHPPPPEHAAVAVLVIGLVRGTADEKHMSQLGDFLTSFPTAPDVFSVLELGDVQMGNCSRSQVSSHVEAAFARANSYKLKILGLDDVAQEQAAFGPKTEHYQHWKSDRAVELMEEAEKTRGSEYEYVVRVRIDANFVDVNWGTLFPPLMQGMKSGTVYAHQDFAWAAGRKQVAQRLGKTGDVLQAHDGLGTDKQQIFKQQLPLDWGAVEKSDWVSLCSLMCLGKDSKLHCPDGAGRRAVVAQTLHSGTGGWVAKLGLAFFFVGDGFSEAPEVLCLPGLNKLYPLDKNYTETTVKARTEAYDVRHNLSC